jgi:hypothetical protein
MRSYTISSCRGPTSHRLRRRCWAEWCGCGHDTRRISKSDVVTILTMSTITSNAPIVRDGERTQYYRLAGWIDGLSAVASRKVAGQRLVGAGSLENDNVGMQPPQGNQDALLVLLPLLIVLSTFLFLLLLFLVCVLLLRKRRGILLRDSDGPVDMGREELIDGEGGFEGVESRWLESVDEETRRSYLKAKGEMTFNRIMTFLNAIMRSRLPNAESTQLHAHRHNAFPVFGHTRERCLRLVL